MADNQSKVSKKKRNYVIRLINGVLCIIIAVVMFAVGFSMSSSSGKISTSACYNCDGYQKNNHNGVIVECPTCNGLGMISYREGGTNPMLIPAAAFGGVGILSFVIAFAAKSKDK